MSLKTTLSALAAILLSASFAAAMEQGPGGRFYVSGRYDDGTDKFIRLASFAIDKDWTVSAVVSHGDVSDMYNDGYPYGSGSSHVNNLIPHIVQSNPTGYATIAMSAFWKDGTLPVNRATPGAWADVSQVLGLLQINPTAAGMNVSVLSAGKGMIEYGSGSTESTAWICPDVDGSFTGTAGSYIQANYWSLQVVRDNTNDGDPLNMNADYTSVIGNHGGNFDFGQKLFAGRLYSSTDYNGITNGKAILSWNSALAPTAFYSGNYMQGNLAVTDVTVNNASATAVYVMADENGFALKQLLDNNNDGVSDSESIVYTNGELTGWSVGDMQIISNGGTKFLAVQNLATEKLVVFQLAADGTIAAGDSIRTLDVPAGTFVGTGYSLKFSSFDALPEPASLALLAAGAAGLLRRRRQ